MSVMATYKAIKEVIGDCLPSKLLIACLNSIIHNDEAHNLKHIQGVVILGYKLCDRLGTDMKMRQMVLAGCLMHDLGCRYNRKTHHQISYGLAFEYLEKFSEGLFTENEVMVIAESCLQHRASWTKDRTHLVCELVALADRGVWDKREYITRSVQFHLNNLGEGNMDAVREEVMKHIPDKFGMEGYAWKKYPSLGFQLFEKEINEFIKFALDPEKVSAMIDAVFVDLKLYR